VALSERGSLERDGAARDLDPGVTPRAHRMHDLVAGLEQRGEQLDVLVHGDRAVVATLRSDQAERAAPPVVCEMSLLVARRGPVALGEDPDLEEVNGLARRGIVLAVRDAGARAHALHVTGSDDRAVPHAVLVLERAVEDVRHDLHVAMGMSREPFAGLDAVL